MKKSVIFLLLSLLFFSCGKKNEEVVINKTTENVTSNENIRKQNTSEDELESTSEEEAPVKTSKNKSGGENYVNIESKDASGKIGTNAFVQGYVADVVVREKVAYLNFDKKYPNNTFSAVVFASKFDDFGDLSEYKNKNVEVKGKISEYSGKAQIILNNKNQIKIINK